MNFKEWYELEQDLQEIRLPNDWSNPDDPGTTLDKKHPNPLGIKAFGDGTPKRQMTHHHSFDPKQFDYDQYFSKQGQQDLRDRLKDKSWFKKDDWVTWDGKKERVNDLTPDQVKLGDDPLEYKLPFRLYWRKGDAFTTGVTEMLKAMDAKYTYRSGVPTLWLHGQNDMADEYLAALERKDKGVIERTRKAGNAAGARYINV